MKKIKQPFEFFDVTADIGFIAFGNTINESFENAGLAMFNVISDTTNIANNKEFDFFIESEDEVSLLYDFLEELLFLHEIEFMLFSDFKVKISKNDNNYRLDAKIKGEEINWNIHERGSEIKAITYHLMNVSINDGIYEVKGIFDL